MFEFYIAAREQKETGHPGIFSRQKHSTIIYVICLLLICLWFAGMVLVGGYARQLWVLWIVKAEVTVEAETPAFKQSTQHYFFKNSHSPSSNPSRRKMTQASRLRMPPLLLKTKKILWKKAKRKLGLRERVKNALNELER